MKWCRDCLMDLEKEDDIEFHQDSGHIVYNIDPEKPYYKEMKKLNKKIVKIIKKNSSEILKEAYAKPITKEDLPGFFKEE